MNPAMRRLAGALLFAGWPLWGTAQNNNAPTLNDPQPETKCQHDVLTYEDSVRFVRTTLGPQAYEALKAKQLSDDERNELLFKGGYCAVVKVLRQRKLIR